MKSVKYIGLDTSSDHLDYGTGRNGKLIMQSVIATQAFTILDLIPGLRGLTCGFSNAKSH